ncbi:hypothetical protein T05_1085 [Trichinella murrelli]|uniref:Uncharacterized protein n=1 Tax=Trichinella murrelli TaxID=144512 RepID=A0A0V0T1B4_9BILA|nr:hypothetical protein T05_1085 [Trichinella murrelli]
MPHFSGVRLTVASLFAHGAEFHSKQNKLNIT